MIAPDTDANSVR